MKNDVYSITEKCNTYKDVYKRQLYRFRSCKAANGEGCKSNASILLMHDHHAAAGYFLPAVQPVPAKPVCIRHRDAQII